MDDYTIYAVTSYLRIINASSSQTKKKQRKNNKYIRYNINVFIYFNNIITVPNIVNVCTVNCIFIMTELLLHIYMQFLN